MSIIGTVESLWRYPVKSMRGEELNEMFAGFAGVFGDRLFAFKSTNGRKGFPYFTGRDQRALLRYRPRFRHPDKAAQPANLKEAENIAPGATPLFPDPADMMIDVETPAGETVALDDPALIEMLIEEMDEKPQLTLLRSERGFTDCRPLSLFGLQSARRLSEETGTLVDKRRFRANIYLDLPSTDGFAEDDLVGRSIRIGSKLVVSVLERDPRCMMITLDPDTGEKEPAILKKVAQVHDGMAGVYGAVMVEGTLRKGDPVEVLD